MNLQEKLRELVLNVVEDNNFELVELQQKRQPKGWLVRVYIDSDNGITVNDCRKISKDITFKLNVETNLIPDTYTLEVSSPGLDRPLRIERDFLRNRGRSVKISFYDIDDEKRFIEGKIIDCIEGHLSLQQEESKIDVPLERVIKANLKVEM